MTHNDIGCKFEYMQLKCMHSDPAATDRAGLHDHLKTAARDIMLSQQTIVSANYITGTDDQLHHKT